MKEKLKAEKQKWKELNGKQKLQYFKDYYLFPVCIVVVVLIFVGNMVWHTFLKPEEKNVLYAAVIDEALDEEKRDQAASEFEAILGADGKTEHVYIDDALYLNDSNMLMKLQVYISCGQIDVMIMDREAFQEYAGNGSFISLDELTDEDLSEKYGQEYEYAAGYLETDEITVEDNESGKGEVKAYGLSLSGDNRFTEMAEGYIENPVFAVVTSSANTENALRFLDYLLAA